MLVTIVTLQCTDWHHTQCGMRNKAQNYKGKGGIEGESQGQGD